jgi:hypothetical protein
MKNKFAGIYGFDCVAAAIAEQLLHDFNLKRQEMAYVKREVSCAKMLRKRMYLHMWIYYGASRSLY